MSAAELIPPLHRVAEDAEFARVLAEAGFLHPESPLPQLVAEAVRWAWPEPRVRPNKMFCVDEMPKGRDRMRISLASGSQNSCLLAAAMLFSRMREGVASEPQAKEAGVAAEPQAKEAGARSCSAHFSHPTTSTTRHQH